MKFVKRVNVKAEFDKENDKSYLFEKVSNKLLWTSEGYDCLRDMWGRYNDKIRKDNEHIS